MTDTKYFWIGCNRFPPCNYDIPPLLRFIYSLQLGFYLQVGCPTPLYLEIYEKSTHVILIWLDAPVQAVPYLIFLEVRRKDFWQNFGHHLATIGLIVYSYQVKYAPALHPHLG